MKRLLAAVILFAACAAPVSETALDATAGPQYRPPAVTEADPGSYVVPTTERPKPRVSRSAPRTTVARPERPPLPAGGALLARIRWCESRNDYTARNPRSTASGAYQFLDGTWRSQASKIEVTAEDGSKTTADRMWPRAYLAPPHIQDQAAAILFAAAGARPWYASRGCWGG